LFIAPAYLILLAHGLCQFRPLVRWALAAGAFYLSLAMLDANVYSQVVKADWRGLARWLNHDETITKTIVPKGPITLAVHPSDPRFPRDQIEAARYYLSPPHRVLLADTATSSGSEPAAEQAALDVYCLSAGQVREGIRDLSRTGFTAPIWQTGATDWHHGVPELYGLIIRRR
jgi:hypothetical protein